VAGSPEKLAAARCGRNTAATMRQLAESDLILLPEQSSLDLGQRRVATSCDKIAVNEFNLPQGAAIMRCPGQDMQYWKPGAIFESSCPQCGNPVEFFKDDTARKCGRCGHRFVNPQMDFGCAAYCPFAEQCLGTLPEGLAVQKENLLKDRVAVEMKRTFRNDFKRIGRTGCR
jgi:hypothetical protein